MTRIVSAASRAGLAGALLLLALAVLRWTPVHAQPPWDVRALPLAPVVLLLAIVAALTGRERWPGPVRPLLAALALAALALAGVVRLRGAAGLAAEVEGPEGGVVRLAPGAIDLLGAELAESAPGRRRVVRWVGELRVPRSGAYRLWADARGEIEVRLDGRLVLRGQGERVRVGSDLPLAAGAHQLEARLAQTGPGPRLRLGWTRPDGRSETIPPRQLGPAGSRALWLLTDALAVLLAALLAALALAVPWDAALPLPPAGPVTRRECALSLVGHAAIVCAMSGGLALDAARQGVVDRADGRLNAWILAWDVHAMRHAPGRLFDAPVFHPLPDTLAFSENLLLPAALAAPAVLLGGPVLGYNLVLLLSYVVSGLGAQLLARRVSGDRLAGFVAGALFAAGAPRWVNMAHLHAQVTLFLPFALVALDRFWERRSLGRALAVGLLLGLQGLSSIYLGAITACALAAATALALLAGLRRDELLRLACGLAAAAVLVAPLARPYFRMRAFQGMEFGLPQLARFATTPESYAAGPAPLYSELARRHLDPQRVKDPLFPGLLPLLLGVAGLSRAPRRYRAFALAASALAVTLSLGPQTAFFRFLHEHVVLFRGIRALARFAVIPWLCLCVLAGLTLAGRWRMALVALGLALAEAWSAPGYGAYLPPSEAARWLAGRAGAVVYLPLGDGDTEAMLQSIAHFRPLLNGDSGFIPRSYDRARERLAGPLGTDALRFLRALDVQHVVTRDERSLPLLARFGEERVYGVPPGEPARLPAPAPPVATLWRRDGILLDLGGERSVERVVFETSDAAWRERPLVELSLDGVSWEAVDASASLADATLALTRDPRHALAEVRFAPRAARYVRLDRRLPARAGALGVG
jgi:hypothetical protein